VTAYETAIKSSWVYEELNGVPAPATLEPFCGI